MLRSPRAVELPRWRVARPEVALERADAGTSWGRPWPPERTDLAARRPAPARPEARGQPSLSDRVRICCRNAVNAQLRRYKTRPHLETIYRDLFLRELTRHGLVDDYYPVGGAANHGLLYLLTRLLHEFRFRSILEFGVGQSTILMARLLAQQGLDAAVTSVEHDREWAEQIGDRTGRHVWLAPLVRERRYGVDGLGYQHVALPDEPSELVIVDGPPAFDPRDAYSRLSCLDLLMPRLGDEFVVLVDDAERIGEVYLIATFRRLLRERGQKVWERSVAAHKTQHLFMTGRYRAAMGF